jgi:hypothetical protein
VLGLTGLAIQILSSSRKEATDKVKPRIPVAKPPENRTTATIADKDKNWRVRFADEEDWHATEVRLKDWPKPTSRNELSNFLGAIGRFRDKISNYAKYIRPLTELLRNDIEWTGVKRKMEHLRR